MNGSLFRLALLLLLALPAWRQAHADETVSFPGRNGVTLQGVLMKPAGAGPFPAVVALHGCGGLGGRKGMNARHRDWGERLVAAGFVVLFPESFASRGQGSQCAIRDRDIRSKDRAYDAFASAEWLASQPYIQRNRIGLLGWSNGGTSVLSAARDIRQPKGVDFRLAVAFYPGCKVMAEQGFRPRIPVTILHGLADNWTPPGPCQGLNGVRFIGYPDAHHDFDHPNLPLKTRKAAFSADGSGVVTIGTNPAAREAAIARVMGIFNGM